MANQPPPGLPVDWHRYVADFAGLKKAMRSMEQRDHADFTLKLSVQVSTATRFAEQTAQLVCKRLWELLHRLLVPAMSGGMDSERERARNVASTLRSLHTLVFCHRSLLESLAAEQQKRCRDAHLEHVFMELTGELAALDSTLGRCVVALGDILSVIRNSEDRTLPLDSKNTVWTAPSSFERTVTKYRVDMQHVMDVKLKILEYLPVLVINKPEPESAAAISSDFLEKQDSAFITSAYLDDRHFQSYHTRAAKEDGSLLHRLRWYGANSQPHANERVFMEQKVHRKKPAVSVKQRFGMRGHEVASLCIGDIEANGEKKSAPWRAEVQAKFRAGELAPSLRTVYRRTAFQRSSTNAVRISLDTDTKFFDVLDRHALPVSLGWAVLEIKLTCAAPEWVDELLECGAIQPLGSFSKFVYGVASFHHGTGMLQLVPSWFEPLMSTRAGTIDSDDSALKLPGKASDVTTESCGQEMDIGSSNSPLLTQPNAVRQLGNGNEVVRPKTYFANERTFIQWLTAAALLLTFSSALLVTRTSAHILGLPLFLVAFALILYALAIYHWRLRQFHMGTRVDYSDRCGPSVLAVLLCISMAAVLVTSFGRATRWQPKAQVGLAVPPGYVERRYARGCVQTPLVLNGTHPDSWEIQDMWLELADFSTMERRQAQLDRLDARIRRFYEVSKISVDWSQTVEKYCLPHTDCHLQFLKHAVESHTITFKFRVASSLPSLPQADPNHTSKSKWEIDSHCHNTHLSYQLKVDGAPPSGSAWTSTAVNSLLAHPFYNDQETVLFDHISFRTKYKYKLLGIGDCGVSDLTVSFQHASEEDRASGRNPTKVELSIRLGANTTFLSIRHAEGLFEYLSEDDSSISMMCAATTLVAVVALAFAFVKYANIEGCTCFLARQHCNDVSRGKESPEEAYEPL